MMICKDVETQMLLASDLNEKWQALEQEIHDGKYKIFLPSEDGHPSLFLARTPNSERALVLQVPSLEHIDFRDVEGANISLGRYTENQFIVITLLNSYFVELFDYLIISICNSISDIRDPQESSKVFLKFFYKWMQFFIIQQDTKHPEHIIQGIFGELIVLEMILKEPDGMSIDSVLSAWRGLYNTSQDFIFDHKNIEVKTRKEGNPSVKIANENQLDPPDGKDLELAVVRLHSQTASGLTLSQLIEKILRICEEYFGDISILFEALRQKNLSPGNLSHYDEYVFDPAEITIFACGEDGFPKLVRSDLPEAISNVGYSINTNKIEEFEVRKVEYNYDQ